MLEKCRCGVCGAYGEWEKITEKVIECKYCAKWQVRDKTFPEKKEIDTRYYSDGTIEKREVVINAIARWATLEECVEASMEKNKAEKGKFGYYKLLDEDIFLHSREGNELTNKIIFAKNKIEEAQSANTKKIDNLINGFVTEIYDNIKDSSNNPVALNAIAYAEVFKEEFEKFKKDNNIKDNTLAVASFFNSEREKGVDNEDFSIKMRTATLYRQLRDNKYEEMYVKNVPAYAKAFKNDLNKYMKEHQITDKNIGIAKFYIYDSERLKGTPEFNNRIKTAMQYRDEKK